MRLHTRILSTGLLIASVATASAQLTSPVPPSPYSIELGVVNQCFIWPWSNDVYGNSKYTTMGCMLDGVYELNKNHAFVLRFSATSASKINYESFYISPIDYTMYADIRTWVESQSLHAGYRYQNEIRPYAKFFAGAYVGLTRSRIELLQHTDPIIGYDIDTSSTAYSLDTTAELGLNLAITERTHFIISGYAGALFVHHTMASSFQTYVSGGILNVKQKISVNNPCYLGFRLGVAYQF